MSLHLLDVEPRDVTAGALGLLLHAPAPAALAEISLRDGRGGLLTLGVLGASHGGETSSIVTTRSRWIPP